MSTIPKFKYRDIIRLNDDEFDFKYVEHVDELLELYTVKTKKGSTDYISISATDETHMLRPSARVYLK